VKAGPLTFQEPDPERFPALAIAKAALATGGRAPAAMNAANERAVAAFLDRRIGFLDIPSVVADTLERMDRHGLGRRLDGDPVECARATDAEARRVADEIVLGVAAEA
jgi:1-deoxy-D-xylulose-5-phosphate reductoisomerase